MIILVCLMQIFLSPMLPLGLNPLFQQQRSIELIPMTCCRFCWPHKTVYPLICVISYVMPSSESVYYLFLVLTLFYTSCLWNSCMAFTNSPGLLGMPRSLDRFLLTRFCVGGSKTQKNCGNVQSMLHWWLWLKPNSCIL